MRVPTFPLAITLLVAALAAGCSTPAAPERGNECRRDRGACMHEGSYEPGEREFAEREAARLNRAATGRLRRSR